ncbi:MAG: hypothetical protein QNK64_02345 [Saprospiraceae bacterium]
MHLIIDKVDDESNMITCRLLLIPDLLFINDVQSNIDEMIALTEMRILAFRSIMACK